MTDLPDFWLKIGCEWKSGRLPAPSAPNTGFRWRIPRENEDCDRVENCLTRFVWMEASKAMFDRLNEFTFADLLALKPDVCADDFQDRMQKAHDDARKLTAPKEQKQKTQDQQFQQQMLRLEQC